MERPHHWIREKANTSPNPALVEYTLVQQRERRPANAVPLVYIVEQSPLGEAAQLHLLAVSTICGMRVTRNPETLLWLARPEVSVSSRAHTEMVTELRSLAGDCSADKGFAALRFWKGREMTRVAVRELAAVA